MKKKYIMLVLALVMMSTAKAQNNRLVDVDWLKDRIQKTNLVVFHIGRKKDYDKEHIKGAIYIGPDEYTYEDDTHVFDLPTDEELKTLFESKGVNNQTDVVVYTPENWIPLVTRLYFTLDYLGHGHKTYVLDGGLVAWKASNGAISKDAPGINKSTFDIQPNKNLLADKNDVLASIKNDNIDIIDCRAQVYYSGIEPTHGARKGRVPTAKTIPYTSLYQKTDIGAYKFKTWQEIEAIFKNQGLTKDRDILLYCHIGMQLTVIYTAAQLLGYTNIKMYDGSFHEWGPDESLPIELD